MDSITAIQTLVEYGIAVVALYLLYDIARYKLHLVVERLDRLNKKIEELKVVCEERH